MLLEIMKPVAGKCEWLLELRVLATRAITGGNPDWSSGVTQKRGRAAFCGQVLCVSEAVCLAYSNCLKTKAKPCSQVNYLQPGFEQTIPVTPGPIITCFMASRTTLEQCFFQDFTKNVNKKNSRWERTIEGYHLEHSARGTGYTQNWVCSSIQK